MAKIVSKLFSKPNRKWTILVLAVIVGGFFGFRYLMGRRSAVPKGIAYGNGRIEAKEVDVSAKIPLRVKEVLVAEARSVLDNVWLGIDGIARRTVPRRERRARATEAFSQLRGRPLDLDQPVESLSLSERQTCCLVRALVRAPRVLILDEATSHLDTESESLVQQALQNLMNRRTVIVIAHRLSTIRRADRIVVMDCGRITETGTHDELVGRGGIYQRLHEMQLVSP